MFRIHGIQHPVISFKRHLEKGRQEQRLSFHTFLRYYHHPLHNENHSQTLCVRQSTYQAPFLSTSSFSNVPTNEESPTAWPQNKTNYMIFRPSVCVCVCNSVTQNSKGLQIPDSVMFSLFIACPAVCASAWGHAKTHIVSQSAQSMDVWFWLNIYNLMVYHLWTTAAAHTLRESTWWQSPPTNTGGRANIYWS